MIRKATIAIAVGILLLIVGVATRIPLFGILGFAVSGFGMFVLLWWLAGAAFRAGFHRKG